MRRNLVKTKVRERADVEGAPGARAEISLQAVERTVHISAHAGADRYFLKGNSNLWRGHKGVVFFVKTYQLVKDCSP